MRMPFVHACQAYTVPSLLFFTVMAPKYIACSGAGSCKARSGPSYPFTGNEMSTEEREKRCLGGTEWAKVMRTAPSLTRKQSCPGLALVISSKVTVTSLWLVQRWQAWPGGVARCTAGARDSDAPNRGNCPLNSTLPTGRLQIILK